MITGAIIQARMSSSRLPGKVLKPLPYGSTETVLSQVVKRFSAVSEVDTVIIATSEDPSDDPIVEFCKNENINYYRGSLKNVLDRYFCAANKYELDVIIRGTGDCPCIDPEIISRLIRGHLDNKADFSSSAIKRTFPYGMDAGVVNFSALKEAHEKTTEAYEKEHVTPYFYKSNPEKFKNFYLLAEDSEKRSDIRLTVDYKEDYTLVCEVFDNLYEKNEVFGLKEILHLMKKKPWLRNINEYVSQKSVKPNLEDEVNALKSICEDRGYEKALEFFKKNGL